MSGNPATRQWASDVKRAFGQNVRRVREAAAMTQADLGRATGFHPTYISAVERGVRNPGHVNVVKLACGLNVDPGELFEGVPRAPGSHRLT